MRYIRTLFTLLLFSSVTAFAQYNIQFRVNGLQKGDECILAHYYANQNKVIDTSAVDAKGVITYKGEGKLDNGVYIIVLPKKTYIEFIVPKEDQEFEISFDTSLSVQSKKVVGSLDNEIFFDFDRFSQKYGDQKRILIEKFRKCEDDPCREKIRQEVKVLDDIVDGKRKEINTQYPTTFTAKLLKTVLEIEIPEDIKKDETGKAYAYYKEHFWDNIDLGDDGMLRTPIFQGKLQYYIDKVITPEPDSLIPAIDDLCNRIQKAGGTEMYKFVIWWNTNHHEESNRICMDKVLYHMAKNYYVAGKCSWADSTTVAKMAEYTEKTKLIQCGLVAPNMTLYDTTYLRKYELHKVKSPVTIVVFWSHTCGHCKKEIPKLKEMYDTLHSRGVEIYAVYTQDDVDGWKKYIRENKLTWMNLVDAYNNSTFRKDYNQVKTPEVFLLDENKVIQYKNPPAENVGKIVEMMLDEYEELHGATE